MYLACARPPKTRRPEIIKGLFREGQIVTLSGSLNVGKTPIIKDWAVAIASGRPWCGLPTFQRPVVILDFESDDCQFEENLSLIVRREKLWQTPLPIYPLLMQGGVDDPGTEVVERLLTLKKPEERFDWIADLLRRYPNCLFIVDPVQMVFNFDKNKSEQVITLYSRFRKFKKEFPTTTFLFVFNLRKRDPSVPTPPLLTEPDRWLLDVAGSVDLNARGDTRLGLDFLDAKERAQIVLNGLRRGERMEPLVLESCIIGENAKGEPLEAGFVATEHGREDLTVSLSPRKLEAFQEAADEFDLAYLETRMARSTAYQMRARLKAMGLVEVLEDGRMKKR